MIKHTHEEIVSFAKKVFNANSDKYGFRGAKIDVTMHAEEAIQITVSSMYEFVALEFIHLCELAEFFGTKNINDDDRHSSDGCETCDYGATYTFTLTIRPETKKGDSNG